MGKIALVTESIFAVYGVCGICREEKLVEFTGTDKAGFSFSICRDCRNGVISRHNGQLTGSLWISEEFL